jgi:hypothetical protein
MSQSRYEELLVALPRQDLSNAAIHKSTVIEDLRFFNAWEEGRARSLSAIFRARQIRRANPLHAVEDRPKSNPSQSEDMV